MADLEPRIRLQLAAWRLNVESLREHGMDLIALDVLMEAQAAIGAVLDLHKPHEHYGKPLCGHCVYPMGGDEVDYPCDTVRAIAEKLGVEVDGG